MEWGLLLNDIRDWADAHGIRVERRPGKREQAGAFDGLSLTVNSDYDEEEQAYYSAHALGSIVLWSLNRAAVQAMFDELRAGKHDRSDSSRLEQAIDTYRTFENESSELGAGLLARLGHPSAIPSYSNFMRADLEALTEFHRAGRAPNWRKFFARWNNEVATGRRRASPFPPKPPPEFVPVRIERQVILQEQG